MEAVVLVTAAKFDLDGEFVRMRLTSGAEVRDYAVPMAVFLPHGPEIRAMLVEWHARQAAVIPLKTGKRKRKRH